MAGFEDDVTSRVAADKRGERIWSVELVVTEGTSRGKRAVVVGGVAKIGTAKGNDLQLVDPTVSRFHCELRVRGDAVALRDVGSTNGTIVDGLRVRDADIPPGALLHVGQTLVRVEVGDEPAFVDVSDKHSFGELVGVSVAMRRLYAILERVAKTDSTVLVLGETGTGKEVVARSLHAASHRAAGPLVTVDCGSIPENLIESELFGHVRGAFSGATADRKGVLEEANGGTLFLDEIGEMPLALQPKLLRALETRTVRRVGSNADRPIDVRIVAATNRPLTRSVNEGTFREDLYYRLAVVEVVLPPLRSRREDLPHLARHFHRRITGKDEALPAEFLAALQTRSFEGNVRELRNYIERSVALGLVGARRPSVPPPHPSLPLESTIPVHLPLKEARDAWMESFESVYVRTILKKTSGNVTHAATMAGVSRRFLQRTIARLGIKPAEVGADPREWEKDE
jgi:DNA-binding NtrC family response regulator